MALFCARKHPPRDGGQKRFDFETHFDVLAALTIGGTFRIISIWLRSARQSSELFVSDTLSSIIHLMFRNLWHEWLRVSKHIGSFNARALITLIYFTVLALFGIPLRWLADPMGVKRRPEGSAWHDRVTKDLDLESAQRQG